MGKVPNWECLFVNRDKRTILVRVCGRYWLGRNKTLTQCGKYSRMKSIWENRHHLSIMFIWVALNENAKRAKILWKIEHTCLNPESLREQRKNYIVPGNLTQTSLHGSTIRKVVQRNVWSDIVSRRTKQHSNCTKLQLQALMTTNSKKKTWDLLDIAKSMLSNCLEMLAFGTHCGQ